MEIRESGKSIILKLVQPEKQRPPIYLTVLGIEIMLSREQPSKQSSGKLVIPSGIVTVSKLLHCQKVRLPNDVTDSGISIEIRLEHPRNTLPPNNFIFGERFMEVRLQQ